MQIKGTISFQELEGGFWGIIGSDGNKYVPIEPLPDNIRVDGLAVQADVEPVHMLGTTMWGKTTMSRNGRTGRVLVSDMMPTFPGHCLSPARHPGGSPALCRIPSG